MTPPPWLCLALLVAWAPVTLSQEDAPQSIDATTLGSLTLDQAILLALQRNPDIHAAKARIGTAQAQLQEVTAAFLPHLSASLSYTSSNDPSRAFGMIVAQRRFNFDMDINDPGFQEDFRPQVSLRWSLFRGGQDYFRRQAAKLGIAASKAQMTALRHTLATSVSTAFYGVLVAPQQIDVARRTAATVTKELELMRDRLQQGMALKSDLLSLEVRLAQALEQEIRAQNAADSARFALRTLLAVTSVEPLAIDDKGLPALPQDAGEFADWLAKAWRQRPELIAADNQVKAREKQWRAARGERLPRLNAFATYGQNTQNPRFSTNKDNLTMGIQAELDLFSGGAVSARIAKAHQRLEEAKALRESTRLQVEREVKQAWLGVREALAQVEVARRRVAAAQEAFHFVEAQYHGGTATITRFLEAETDLAAARLHLISSRFNALIAAAEIRRASGTWSFQEPSS